MMREYLELFGEDETHRVGVDIGKPGGDETVGVVVDQETGKVVNILTADEVQLALKRQELQRLTELRAGYIESLRQDMKALYLDRASRYMESAYVDGNDLRLTFESYPAVPDSLSRSFLATVFRGEGWEFTGKYSTSRVQGSHGREVKRWRYVGVRES